MLHALDLLNRHTEQRRNLNLGQPRLFSGILENLMGWLAHVPASFPNEICVFFRENQTVSATLKIH